MGYTLALLEAMVQIIMAKFEMIQLGPGTTLNAINKLLQLLNKNYNMKIFSGFGLMTSQVSENLTLPRMIKDHLIWNSNAMALLEDIHCSSVNKPIY